MASPKSPHLAVLAGASAGATYIFDPVDNGLIGSDPSCQLCIESEDVSPIHARIWVDAEGVTVRYAQPDRRLRQRRPRGREDPAPQRR